MAAINGPGGPNQSRWEHVQVTTASSLIIDARWCLQKVGVLPIQRAEEARKLGNKALEILAHMAGINSTWLQNEFYTETKQSAQILLQDVARIQEGSFRSPAGG